MFFKIKIAIRSDTHVIKRVSILPMTISITVHIYNQLDDVSHIISLCKSLTKKKLDVTVLSECLIGIFKFLNSSQIHVSETFNPFIRGEKDCSLFAYDTEGTD